MKGRPSDKKRHAPVRDDVDEALERQRRRAVDDEAARDRRRTPKAK